MTKLEAYTEIMRMYEAGTITAEVAQEMQKQIIGGVA